MLLQLGRSGSLDLSPDAPILFAVGTADERDVDVLESFGRVFAPFDVAVAPRGGEVQTDMFRDSEVKEHFRQLTFSEFLYWPPSIGLNF